jgi:uncharacterized protein YoxC
MKLFLLEKLNNTILFIEYYWKAVFVAMIFSMLIILFIKSCKHTKETSPVTTEITGGKVEQWNDENKNLHAKVQILMQDNISKIKEIDSLRKIIKIKPKQVIAYSSTAGEFTIDAKPSVTRLDWDTIPTYKFDLQENSDTHIWGTTGTNNDSIHAVITDTLKQLTYWKRAWFLGSKNYYEDITNTNKNIKVYGYKGTQLIKKEKQWSIGIDLQIGYPFNQPINFRKPVISAGISIQKPIIRF